MTEPEPFKIGDVVKCGDIVEALLQGFRLRWLRGDATDLVGLVDKGSEYPSVVSEGRMHGRCVTEFNTRSPYLIQGYMPWSDPAFDRSFNRLTVHWLGEGRALVPVSVTGRSIEYECKDPEPLYRLWLQWSLRYSKWTASTSPGNHCGEPCASPAEAVASLRKAILAHGRLVELVRADND